MATTVRRFRHIAMVTGASLMLMTGPGVLAAQATPIPATPSRCVSPSALVVPPGGADFVGTLGDDIIVGTPGPDRIFGDAGNDRICGGDGEDYIDGGGQNDTIYGEGHRDILLGDTGNDDIFGGPNPPAAFARSWMAGQVGMALRRVRPGLVELRCGIPRRRRRWERYWQRCGRARPDRRCADCDTTINVP